MCLIALAYRCHPGFPLLVAANRDEYYRRPTAPADFWEDHPDLLAGRDLQAGGTWMGVDRRGRFAAITNHRNPPTTPESPRSRGMLTLDFLVGETSAEPYLHSLAAEGGNYAGFNLMLSDDSGLYYYSNIEGQVRRLEPGVYGLSNGLLDSAWPKQCQAADKLRDLIPGPIDHAGLQATVSNRAPAPIEDLPDTGLSSEMELALSSQFIVTGEYGTRATTSLSLDGEGQAHFLERSFTSGGSPDGEQAVSFSVNAY